MVSAYCTILARRYLSFVRKKGGRLIFYIVAPDFLAESDAALRWDSIVGSFLNVVIVRLPHGKIDQASFREVIVLKCPRRSFIGTRNIPVFSYLALRGRCRGCKNPISVRYPIVELLTALLFIAVKIKFGFSWLLFARDWPFVAILVAVTFIDLEHRHSVPDELSFRGSCFGSQRPRTGRRGLGSSELLCIGAAVGFWSFLRSCAWTYLRLTRKSGLGGGDIKLLAMIGGFSRTGRRFCRDPDQLNLSAV